MAVRKIGQSAENSGLRGYAGNRYIFREAVGTENSVTKRASIVLFTFHKDLQNRRHYNEGNNQQCNGSGQPARLQIKLS